MCYYYIKLLSFASVTLAVSQYCNLIPGARKKRRSAWYTLLRMRLISPDVGSPDYFLILSCYVTSELGLRTCQGNIVACNESFQQAISHALQRLATLSVVLKPEQRAVSQLFACTLHTRFSEPLVSQVI